MTDTTPLGWPVLEPGSPTLYTWQIPGTVVKLTMREGTVGFVIACYVVWYHRTVERISAKDAGAFNHRRVTGGTTWSEHAAGTAVDLRWGKHPYNTRPERTFTLTQIRAIRRKLAWWQRLAGGQILRWGGDYRTNPDPMHTEAVGPIKRHKRMAAILKRTATGRAVLALNPTQKRFL